MLSYNIRFQVSFLFYKMYELYFNKSFNVQNTSVKKSGT